MQLANRVPIDDDYFYEHYGVPKPENYDEIKQQQEERRQATLDALRTAKKDENKDENQDEDKGQKEADKKGKLFAALADFFGFAPM